MSLAKLEQEIEQLTPAEFDTFARWMDDFAAQKWDARFQADALAGKLDALGRQADRDFEAGKCRPL